MFINRYNKSIKKDSHLRTTFKKYELQKLVFKLFLIQVGKNNQMNYKFYLYKYFKRSVLKSSKTSLKNFCILTGRSKGVLRSFKVSRIKLKELGLLNLISSVYKV